LQSLWKFNDLSWLRELPPEPNHHRGKQRSGLARFDLAVALSVGGVLRIHDLRRTAYAVEVAAP